jgi:hypothetical protein
MNHETKRALSSCRINPGELLKALSLFAAQSWSGRRFNTLADRPLLSQLSSSAKLTGLLVVLVLAKFLLQAASFQKLLESTKRRANGFAVVHTHPNGHNTFSVPVRRSKTATTNGLIYRKDNVAGIPMVARVFLAAP